MNLISKKILMLSFLVVSIVACGGDKSPSPNTPPNNNGGVVIPSEPEPKEPLKDIVFKKNILNEQGYKDQMVKDSNEIYVNHEGFNKGYSINLSNDKNKPLNIKNKSITLKLDANAFPLGTYNPNKTKKNGWDYPIINLENALSNENKLLSKDDLKKIIPKAYYEGLSNTSILSATDGGKINLIGENKLKIEGKSGYKNSAIRVGFNSELNSDKLSIETDGIGTGGIDIYGGGKVTLKDSTKIKAKGIGSYGISVGKDFDDISGYTDKTMKALHKKYNPNKDLFKNFSVETQTPLSGTLIAKDLTIESDFYGIIANSSNIESDVTTIKIDGLKIKSGLIPIDINSKESDIELKDAVLETVHSDSLIRLVGDNTKLTLKGNTRLSKKDGIAININRYNKYSSTTDFVDSEKLDKNYKEDFKDLKDSMKKNIKMSESEIDEIIKSIYIEQIDEWKKTKPNKKFDSTGSLILQDNTYVEGSILFDAGTIYINDKAIVKLNNNNNSRISAKEVLLNSKDATISISSGGKPNFWEKYEYKIESKVTSEGIIDLQNGRTNDYLEIKGNYFVKEGKESTLKLDFKFYDDVDTLGVKTVNFTGDQLRIWGDAKGKTNVEFKNIGKADLDGFEITNEMAGINSGFNVIDVRGNAEHAEFNLKGDITAGAFTYKLDKIETNSDKKSAYWAIISDKVPQ